MQTDELPEVLDVPDAGPTLLDSLRARRDEIAKAEAPTLDLAIPGYDGRLVCRYRYPEQGYQAIIKAVNAAQNAKDPDAILTANAQALIACCDEMLGRDSDGGALQPIVPGENVRYGRKLAGLFGIEVPEDVKGVGTFIVRHVFSPRAHRTGIYDGDVALIAQGGTVIGWLQDTSRSVSESFAGES